MNKLKRHDIVHILNPAPGAPDVASVMEMSCLNGSDSLYAVELWRDGWRDTYTSDRLELVARPGEVCRIQTNEAGDETRGELVYLGGAYYGYKQGNVIWSCHMDKVWGLRPAELEVVVRGKHAAGDDVVEFLKSNFPQSVGDGRIRITRDLNQL